MSREALNTHLTAVAEYLTLAYPLVLLTGHAPADIGLSLIGILFLLHCVLMRKWQWCREPCVQIFAILWGYMCLRALFAQNAKDALKHALPFVRYGIFAAAIAYWTLQDGPTRRRFFLIFALAVVFLAADGLLQWRTGKDIFRREALITTYEMMRLTGPFHNPILGIMLLWLFFPVCMGFVMDEQGKIRKPVMLIAGIGAIMLVAAAIFLSGERMASMLLLLGFGLLALLLPVRKRYVLGTVAVVVLIFSVVLAASPKMFERHINQTMHVFTHWQESPYGLLLSSDMYIAKHYPIFGVGTGQFRYACPDIYYGQQVDLGLCNIHPHHIYFEWLIENGIIGLGLFLALLVVIAKSCIRVWPQHKFSPYFPGLIVALIVKLWPLASSTSFLSPWGAPPFWLVLGALLAYTAQDKKVSLSC